MDQKKWRLLLGSLLFALMLLELCIRSYLFFIHVGSSDGWIAARDPQTNDFVIARIDPGGPATTLNVGDEFISINDITLDQNPAITGYCLTVPPGTNYKMTVRREGKEVSFHLKTVPLNQAVITIQNKAWIFSNLLSLIVGFGVLLLKPDSKQAWLLSLMLCTFPGVNTMSNLAVYGPWIEYPYSLSKLIGCWFIPLFAQLFLWIPERSAILQKYPRIEKYLNIPFYLIIIPSFVATRLPLQLTLTYDSLPVIGWVVGQTWFNLTANLALIFFILVSGLFIALNYREANINDRARLRIIMAGSGFAVVSFLALVLSETIPDFSLHWPGLQRGITIAYLLASTLIPISFAYAILRHKVIPISIIIRRGIRYLLVSSGAATLVFTIIWIVMFTVMDTIYGYFQISSIKWISALSGIIAIIVWNAAYTLYQQNVAPVIDRHFFRETYDAREILSGLQHSITVVKDNSKLMELVGVAIQKALHSNSISFYVRDEHSENFKKHLSINYNSGNIHYSQNGDVIPQGSYLLRYLKTSHEPMEVDYLSPSQNNMQEFASDNEQVGTRLNRLNHAGRVLSEKGKSLLVPIATRGAVTRVMLLGPRLGDLPYSREDRQMLKSIAGQMSTALDNIRLIERMIEEERLRREIEAQNEMRAKELEDARILQLSMLPRELPKIQGIEIAAYMKTAAEVGGDYYDFHVAEDGTLTVVVGDATGHGLKAGTVVTATKGLFEAFAGKTDIAEIFQQSSSALKRMNLKSLYMAMTMLKINNRRISIGIAGMPPALIYRANSNDIEELDLYGVPLGAISKYSFRTKEIVVNRGDVILLMTDGLAERFNAENNILGYSEIKGTFTSCGNQSPQEIITKLSEIGDRWGGGRPQDDDITFVVLKF